jgi:hypothetical protein
MPLSKGQNSRIRIHVTAQQDMRRALRVCLYVARLGSNKKLVSMVTELLHTFHLGSTELYAWNNAAKLL